MNVIDLPTFSLVFISMLIIIIITVHIISQIPSPSHPAIAFFLYVTFNCSRNVYFDFTMTESSEH